MVLPSYAGHSQVQLHLLNTSHVMSSATLNHKNKEEDHRRRQGRSYLEAPLLVGLLVGGELAGLRGGARAALGAVQGSGATARLRRGRLQVGFHQLRPVRQHRRQRRRRFTLHSHRARLDTLHYSEARRSPTMVCSPSTVVSARTWRLVLKMA